MHRKTTLSDTDREIIRRMVELDLNVTETAREMWLHRNSVVHHCGSIKRITGYDPRRFYDEVKLLKLLEQEESHE